MTTNLDISAGLANANTTFMTGHADIFSGGALPGMYQAWTEDIQSNGRIDRNFLANLPKTRKWVGARQIRGVRHYAYTALPESYENTLVFKRLDLTRDKTGTVGQAIGNWLAQEADAHDISVAAALDSNSGTGDTGYDGVALFSASHPHVASSAGYSNIGAGTNLTHANYVSARAIGRLLTHENGALAHIVYSDMRVGPYLEGRAREITGANIVVKHYNSSGVETASAGAVSQSEGMDNVHRGEVRLHVDDRVTTYFWDLFDLTKGSNRPMALVRERDLQPWEQTAMNDERRVHDDEFMWGHDGEWIAIPSMWVLAYRGTGTA